MDNSAVLDKPQNIKLIDKSDMLGRSLALPAMLLEALALAPGGHLVKGKKLSQIVVAGMGGSAIAGDIAADLLQVESELPIYVNRGYQVPGYVGKRTLFLALSYSGDTEETLAAVKAAQDRGAKIICVTSGGKLAELAAQKSWPLFLVPAGQQPRAMLPYLLVPLLKSLEQAGCCSGVKGEIEKTAALLQGLKQESGPENPLRTNPVKQLAKKIAGTTPIILAVSGTSAAAGARLRTQFNENSKVTALLNLFPELNHNEIESLASLKRGQHNFSLIFLRDEEDSERIKKRLEITKSLIGSQLGGANELWAKGASRLSKILSLVYFGDLLSVYLAILRGVDPTPVMVIERLKRELSR